MIKELFWALCLAATLPFWLPLFLFALFLDTSQYIRREYP